MAQIKFSLIRRLNFCYHWLISLINHCRMVDLHWCGSKLMCLHYLRMVTEQIRLTIDRLLNRRVFATFLKALHVMLLMNTYKSITYCVMNSLDLGLVSHVSCLMVSLALVRNTTGMDMYVDKG